MIKVFALLPRRVDVSADYFHEHWRTVHAYHAMRISVLRRYVQSHRTGLEVPGLSEAPYEGVAEVWYDDAASAVGQNEDPDYTEYAKKDEPNFIDVDALRHVMTDDRIFVNSAPPGRRGAVKVLLLVKRSEGTGPDAFSRALHGFCEQSSQALVGASRIADAVALRDEYEAGEPPYDGFIEIAWPDLTSFSRVWAGAEAELLRQLGQFCDTENTHALLVSENPVLVD